MVVMQGKQDFVSRWGKRKNEDNWRRSNRTVIAMDNGEGFDYEADDSLQAAQDSLAQVEDQREEGTEANDSVANDPHQREYYLKDIPFTDEAREASDKVIMDALYNTLRMNNSLTFTISCSCSILVGDAPTVLRSCGNTWRNTLPTMNEQR